MRAFTQDIIDNYTVDYLRKEKIFLLQQEDQNEYITKKKEYEGLIKKLSYDKGKDSGAQTAYYQAQIDELTQKIGNQEYIDAKNVLLKSKIISVFFLLMQSLKKRNVQLQLMRLKKKLQERKESLLLIILLRLLKKFLLMHQS
jgi:hypothetical protein